jgi:hypothetical protein
MEYNVPNTIVPQDVIDGYLNECSKNPALLAEIFSVSEHIKGYTDCDRAVEGRATVHIYVGPQGAGKTTLIDEDAIYHNEEVDAHDEQGDRNEAIIIDRFDMMQQLDSFRVARMNAQDHYDGDMEKFHADLEGITKDYLPAALWMENDVISCAVRNNRTIFVKTSGTNTLKFIDRLEEAGAEVIIHACIAPLPMLFDAAEARYKKNPEFAISHEQIEQEYNRLIEILPSLAKRNNQLLIQVRGDANDAIRTAVHVQADEPRYNHYDDQYNFGLLDGILGNHRMSVEKLMKGREAALGFKVAAEPAPVPAGM